MIRTIHSYFTCLVLMMLFAALPIFLVSNLSEDQFEDQGAKRSIAEAGVFASGVIGTSAVGIPAILYTAERLNGKYALLAAGGGLLILSAIIVYTVLFIASGKGEEGEN